MKALVKPLQLHLYKIIDFIYSIIEFELWPTLIIKNQRFFTRKKIFFLYKLLEELI